MDLERFIHSEVALQVSEGSYKLHVGRYGEACSSVERCARSDGGPAGGVGGYSCGVVGGLP